MNCKYAFLVIGSICQKVIVSINFELVIVKSLSQQSGRVHQMARKKRGFTAVNGNLNPICSK